MARLHSTLLLATDGLRLMRVSCDGRDGPPPEECIEGDRVVLALRGRFVFGDRWTTTVASPAKALFLRSGQTYEIRHPHGEGDLSLAIGGSVARHLVAASGTVRDLSASAYARVQATLRRLTAGEPTDRLGLEEALCLALAPPDRPGPARGRRDRAIAEAIANAVELHYDTRLPLADLAAAADASLFHACRTFRRVMGTSIHRHRQEIRLRHALALLLETRLPLAEVALESGFANQGHLGNAFRRRFGITPGKARAAEGRSALCRLPALNRKQEA